MGHRSGEAVKLGDAKHVAFAREIDCIFKPFSRRNRTDLFGKDPLRACRLKLTVLRFQTGNLLCRACPGIPDDHASPLPYHANNIKDIMALTMTKDKIYLYGMPS
jgi:hypothetical protein